MQKTLNAMFVVVSFGRWTNNFFFFRLECELLALKWFDHNFDLQDIYIFLCMRGVMTNEKLRAQCTNQIFIGFVFSHEKYQIYSKKRRQQISKQTSTLICISHIHI